MRKNSVKNTRINSEVQKILAELIRSELKDPRVPEFTSVTDVEVAPDLKTCKAYISMMGDEQAKSDCRAALKSASGFIRRELAHSVNLR
ncbi:MAG: 30S ribosome-binding factor RbfA, partial [Lachnospiraceae bacterium]|nr:30S ribosome-binding factor RbfA [Lachnospiraceae bacterium]